MSLPPPRPMSIPGPLSSSSDYNNKSNHTSQTSNTSRSTTNDLTSPTSISSSTSPILSGTTSTLISPYNKFFQEKPDLQLDTSLPIPPFLASILSSHSSPASLPPPSTTSNAFGFNSNSTIASSSQITTQPSPNPSAALYTLPPAPSPPEDPLIPPENFSLVASGVYRSGFPKKKNFRFMETLGLKTVLTLVLEEYPAANLKWCEEQDIQFMQFGIPGNKEPFDNIPEDVICSALVAILDRRNHPLLIHCNKGKHRTGCLIGCIRRLQAWSLTSTFDEYRRFSIPKSRAVDQQFIDLFDLTQVWDEVYSDKGGGGDNLPEWGMLAIPRGANRRFGVNASNGAAIVKRDRGSMAGL